MFQEERERFKFDWSHLGDIEVGRPNLGPQTSVAIYRLMQFTLRDAIIRHSSPETARRIVFDAGYTSGKAIYENLIDEPNDVLDLISQVRKLLKELNVGILSVEESDVENMNFTLTVSEDLDCW